MRVICKSEGVGVSVAAVVSSLCEASCDGLAVALGTTRDITIFDFIKNK